MKIHTFDNNIVKPIKLTHQADNKLLFKGFRENYNFGLSLNSYNINEGLRDRKSNYNTSYFLSDLKSLSSVVELDVPYSFFADSKFTTYIKNGDNYAKAENATSSITYDTNFDTFQEKYFFTFNLSTNQYLYITKEIDDDTYFAFASAETLFLSAAVPPNEAHLFKYTIHDSKIKLIPAYDLDDNTKIRQLIFNSNTVSATEASTDPTNTSSVFEINRNTITNNKKNLNNTFSLYLSSYNKDDVNLNLSTTVDQVSNNFLLFGNNYSLSQTNESLSVDLLPLKNQATLEEFFVPVNHYNSQPSNLNRVYEKIYSGNNQETGYDKLYLSYNIGTKDVKFEPSKLTYFTTPSSLAPYTRVNVNDSKLETLGAIASNNPLMADKIFKRREEIKNNYFTDETVNATYLCSWLSGNEEDEKIWVDRFYNPDYLNFNTALRGTSFFDTVTSVGASASYIFDLKSKLTFEPNNDYAFYHIGERDYEQHLISLEKYSLSNDIEILTSKGAPADITTVKRDTEIDFDGDKFARFITDKKGDFSFSFWLSAQDYSKPLGYQLLGNYFEEGFGIFNTDLVTPNIYLPHDNKLLLINNDFEVYDEIELLEGNNPVNIKAVARKDNFSEFYLLGENNVIYIYNSNPNLVSKVTDLSGVSNLVIDDIELTEDRIYLSFNPLNGPREKIFFYDTKNNQTFFQQSVSANTYGKRGKIHSTLDDGLSFFEADANINTGNEMDVDSQGNKFTIKQKYPLQQAIETNLIYKNSFINNNTNTIELTGGQNNTTATNLIIDDEDFLYIIYDQNKIAKLKNTRELVDYTTLNFLDKTSKKYIDLIYDFEGKEYKKYILIVEKLSDRTLIHKLNFDFTLVKTKSLGSINLNNLNLTKSVTSYNFLKKLNANKNRFKVVLKTKPAFTSTGAFDKLKSVIDYDITQLENGYNHFAVNVSTKTGFMELYVNGIKFQRVHFAPGKYSLDNPLGSGIFVGALSTPYNLTLASRLLQKGKYLLRDIKIKGFKMYNRPIDYFEIKSHINYHTVNKDTVWSLPVGQRVYTDTIDRVFKFTVPEKVTNTYDVEIRNLGIEDLDLLNKIEDEIRSEVPKVTPYFDKLREIILTTSITPEPDAVIEKIVSKATILLNPGECLIKFINGRRTIFFEQGEYEVEKDDIVIKIPDIPLLGGGNPVNILREIPEPEPEDIPLLGGGNPIDVLRELPPTSELVPMPGVIITDCCTCRCRRKPIVGVCRGGCCRIGGGGGSPFRPPHGDPIWGGGGGGGGTLLNSGGGGGESEITLVEDPVLVSSDVEIYGAWGGLFGQNPGPGAKYRYTDDGVLITVNDVPVVNDGSTGSVYSEVKIRTNCFGTPDGKTVICSRSGKHSPGQKIEYERLVQGSKEIPLTHIATISLKHEPDVTFDAASTRIIDYLQNTLNYNSNDIVLLDAIGILHAGRGAVPGFGINFTTLKNIWSTPYNYANFNAGVDLAAGTSDIKTWEYTSTGQGVNFTGGNTQMFGQICVLIS